MPEKENMVDDAREDLVGEGAEEIIEGGDGEQMDPAELTVLLEDARGKADEHWDKDKVWNTVRCGSVLRDPHT